MPLYPHVKLTRERFPRVLATRIVADDDAEYFGPFLNRSNARILIDFLNRTFRLRSCEIDIDGRFNYPCTMYYKRRCLGPCVSDLCDEAAYGEMVALVRSFLLNDRELFRLTVSMKIEAASGELDFERAAKWRDLLDAVEAFWADSRRALRIEETSDTFDARGSDDGLDTFLISQKGRRVLGERIFSFLGATDADSGEAVADVVEQFYRFHAPREIRVLDDFPRRRELQRVLSSKFDRRVPIIVVGEANRKKSTDMAVHRSSAELDVKRAAVRSSAKEIAADLKKIFSLKTTPKKLCAVDAAHISGSFQVAASIGWSKGKSDSGCAGYMLSENESELGTLGEFVATQFRLAEPSDLVLIDGGPAQLKAALNAGSKASFIAAVKPPGRHGEISHFLTSNGERIDFDEGSPAMLLLLKLRDEAHDFANAIHRDTRDFASFYELAGVLPSLTESERQRLVVNLGSNARVKTASASELKNVLGDERAVVAMRDLTAYANGEFVTVKPLVVPLRFQDENGAADDLRPIEFFPGRARKGK